MKKNTLLVAILASFAVSARPADGGSHMTPLWQSGFGGGYHYAFAPPGNEISNMYGWMAVGGAWGDCRDNPVGTQLHCWTPTNPASCPEGNGIIGWVGMTTTSGTWNAQQNGFLPCEDPES